MKEIFFILPYVVLVCLGVQAFGSGIDSLTKFDYFVLGLAVYDVAADLETWARMR